jgi:SAM-dependent methyltransferase
MVVQSIGATLVSLKSAMISTVPRKYRPIISKSYYYSLFLALGNQVECPCCDRTFIRFLSVKPGTYLVPNEKCPNCSAWKRHRLLWLYLRQKTNFFTTPLKVLHMAPEACLQNRFKQMDNLDYLSADIVSPIAMMKMDITNIPFEADSFDVILCSHVLEHIDDDHKAMTELLRVLKPGGWAILQVPIDQDRSVTFEDPTIVSPQDRERFFWQHDHVRLYGRDYADRLSHAGFRVNVDTYVKSLDAQTIKRYELDPEEDIYQCFKPIPS